MEQCANVRQYAFKLMTFVYDEVFCFLFVVLFLEFFLWFPSLLYKTLYACLTIVTIMRFFMMIQGAPTFFNVREKFWCFIFL
jgi:hypothetical protein